MAEHALHLESDESVDHSHAHPSQSIYIRIAIILAAITTVEVAIYYIQWFHDAGVLVPALAILSIAKFILVVAFFMHLKFDDARFRYIFVCGLVLAVAIVAALVALMRTHKIEYGLRLISGS